MPWSWLIGVNYIDRLYCPEFPVIGHLSFVIFRRLLTFRNPEACPLPLDPFAP